MRGFFYPRSMVVIGVSDAPDNLARGIVLNLHRFGFAGPVHLVGSRAGALGRRPIHATLEEVEGELDLAVILTPARSVPGILDACGRRGIRRVVIETGGFAELGAEGLALSAELVAIAARHGIRFIGPNGVGAMNFLNGCVLPFAPIEPGLRRGGVSIIAQSGGVGLCYVRLAGNEQVGVAKAVSVGNKLNVDENDLLEHLLGDPETRAVVLYLESLTDGRRFMEIARGADKPIFVHKANLGCLSHTIAASHTAALAGDDVVVDAALRQVGVVRFTSEATLLCHLRLLPLPRLRGNRLAILSRSGGHAVIAADACEREGFALTDFPASFIDEVQGHYRAKVIRLGNPLDLGDLFDFDVYGQIARQTLALPDVDGLVFIHTYVPSLEREGVLLDDEPRLGRVHGGADDHGLAGLGR
jgi:acyl-CoA synthetase (NDP forming)